MHREDPVSATHQMYLKALYRLSQNHPVGRVKDLALELGVTPGTVSTVLTKLQDLGLVEREHYGGALLTATGEALGECIDRRFEILRTLLTVVLRLDEGQAASDACLMEHAISPVTLNRISTLLAHLEAGKSIDLESLESLYDTNKKSCSDCEAEGVCKAAEAAALPPKQS